MTTNEKSIEWTSPRHRHHRATRRRTSISIAACLGLRLVKLTVNFDDPASYHLYYGDELGRPGTILTFFAWPGAYRGRIGPPQVTRHRVCRSGGRNRLLGETA